MSFTFYKQHDSMDCGPACLKMIARHYGKQVDLEAVRQKTQIGKEGVNMLGISEAADHLGFRTRAIKLNASTLTREALLPAILHWNQNHFVVLYKVHRNTCSIADPAKGLIKYTVSELKDNWESMAGNGEKEGVALLLEPSPAFYSMPAIVNEGVKKERGVTHMIRYILPFKKMLFQLLLGLMVATGLQFLLPFLTRSIVDTGINTANIHFIYIVLIGQLALFAGRLAIDFIRSWNLLHISTHINISILTDFLIKLMKLPVAFFDSKRTGDILQRMSDHRRIETFLTGSSLNILFSIINLCVFSVILFFFNGGIFMVFAIASVCYAIWVAIYQQKRKALDHKRFQMATGDQNNTIQLIQGMQEIKLLGVEKAMRWSWERMQARLFMLSKKDLAINQYQQMGTLAINEGKNIIITFLSAKAVIDGQITLGTMMAVQYIIGQLNSPIEQLLGFLQSWQNARISMDRLNEIHSLEDEEPEHQFLIEELPPAFTRLPPNQDTPSIVFQNVSFTYAGAGNEPVLQDINMEIPCGKTTAVVGTSGSGKTTLLKLLLKFYEPQQGTIRLGRTALANISHGTWRSHCGVVMQESYIFSDSIAQNIAVGETQIDMDRLYQAVEIANISDFIESLPLGFNTRIGPEGTGISMGQRQRILIARAVYRNPAFLLLDEATNSLDANNESKIVHSLHTFLKNKTVVVVAHRLSTVKHADQIVVLNKGMITERGTHQELINLKGAYYTLVKNQLELGE
jgi:ATP-binding cassette subfamily B protein